jgi:hypothetical protein
VFDAINFADFNNANGPFDPGNRGNSTSFRVKIAGYLCPSDIDRLTNVHGHNNYVASSGSDPRMNSVNANGLFIGGANGTVDTRTLGFRDVIDGLTNTIAFSERIKGIGGGADDNGLFRDTAQLTASIAQLPQPSPNGPEIYLQRLQAARPQEDHHRAANDPPLVQQLVQRQQAADAVYADDAAE